MTTFEVDVDYAFDHAALKLGLIDQGTSRVTVLTDYAAEACLIAAQMVIARGRYATATRIVL